MPDYSFGPERRVKRRSDFLRIQNSGKKFRSKHLMLVVSPRAAEFGGSESSPEMRLGVTITTKVDKRAARRNRLRRRLREHFRLIRHRLQGNPADLVVIARSGSTELDFEQLRKEFHYLLYQGSLLKGKGRARERSGARASNKTKQK